MEDELEKEDEIPLTPNFYTWIKDKNFKFVYCSESIARICGLDSPKQIIGKTDYDLVWSDKASLFRHSDSLILHEGQNHLNVVERIKVVEAKAKNKLILGENDILITKSRLFNKQGKCTGIVGSHVDITGFTLVKKTGFTDEQGNFYLGNTFGNTYLTKREVEVFKLILEGYCAKKIAKILNISYRTVESHTEAIKLKLQSPTKGDIISTAVRLGLSHILINAE